jgi:hypothetical protein
MKGIKQYISIKAYAPGVNGGCSGTSTQIGLCARARELELGGS